MEKISAPKSTIQQMQKTLKNSRQKESAARAKKISSEKVGAFKAAIQQRNKNKLKGLSQYSNDREQFVKKLLSQYKNINVEISNLQLISKENKARAQVELTDLVDINNKKVTPGSWSKFEIIVRHNDMKELKIYW